MLVPVCIRTFSVRHHSSRSLGIRGNMLSYSLKAYGGVDTAGSTVDDKGEAYFECGLRKAYRAARRDLRSGESASDNTTSA